MKKIVLILTLLTLVFTACEKDKNTVSSVDNNVKPLSLLNKKWVQQKWYQDSCSVEITRTVQIWEFLNDSIMKRTVTFPNDTEYNTYTIYDKWAYTNITNDSRKFITVEYDSLFYLINNGTGNSHGSKLFEIKTFTEDDLILESMLCKTKYIFKSETGNN